MQNNIKLDNLKYITKKENVVISENTLYLSTVSPTVLERRDGNLLLRNDYKEKNQLTNKLKNMVKGEIPAEKF